MTLSLILTAGSEPGKAYYFWEEFNMAASEEKNTLFPIFIFSLLALPLVPYTIFQLYHLATKKARITKCQCSVCLQSGKYHKSVIRRVSFLSNL